MKLEFFHFTPLEKISGQLFTKIPRKLNSFIHISGKFKALGFKSNSSNLLLLEESSSQHVLFSI